MPKSCPPHQESQFQSLADTDTPISESLVAKADCYLGEDVIGKWLCSTSSTSLISCSANGSNQLPAQIFCALDAWCPKNGQTAQALHCPVFLQSHSSVLHGWPLCPLRKRLASQCCCAPPALEELPFSCKDCPSTQWKQCCSILQQEESRVKTLPDSRLCVAE